MSFAAGMTKACTFTAHDAKITSRHFCADARFLTNLIRKVQLGGAGVAPPEATTAPPAVASVPAPASKKVRKDGERDSSIFRNRLYKFIPYSAYMLSVWRLFC